MVKDRRDEKREYRKKNKEKIKEQGKIYYQENKDKVLKRQKMRRILKQEEIKKYHKEYSLKNQEKLRIKSRNYYRNLKIRAINILGGKCEFCGDTNLNHLSIDHIKEDGFLDRQAGLSTDKLFLAIVNNTLPKDRFLNLRVLCYNHNYARRRGYLDSTDLIPRHKRLRKLWEEAYDFFGPCKTCGETELKFLTTSHIHDDGAERKRNGEPNSGGLLAQFRKSGWPESLKEDFCFECWNCNCGRFYSRNY
jgi:hypothetical protein